MLKQQQIIKDKTKASNFIYAPTKGTQQRKKRSLIVMTEL